MNRLMMVIILALIVPVVLLAQINWTEHTIADNFSVPYSIYAIDLDDDNDVDVLGAATDADDITWWENDGSSPPNFTEHTIDSIFDGARSVYAIDVNGDSAVDVLGAAHNYSNDGGNITWWENDGASPPNFIEHAIADSSYRPSSFVYAIDLDNDNDIDVLGATFGTITWWENDGNENFTEYTIADNILGVNSVYAIDLDNDNDIDVLGAALLASDITWWENDGASPPNFIEHTIADNFSFASSVYAIDVNGDSLVDVLGAARYADDITWWENDGNENFTEHTIADNFDGANSVYAIDVNGDGAVDVLGAALTANDITWWENDGNENFTEHTIKGNFTGAWSVYAIDLDGDNYIDVLGAAQNAHDITWWENNTIVDVGPVSIDIPSSLPTDTTLNPQATVKNPGSDDASFDVTCIIEPGAYTAFETVTTLASGDSIEVTFSDPFTFVGGLYTVTVYTQLAGDENPANDTLEKEVNAIMIDVGPVSIDIPSTVPEDTTFQPLATVKNLGTHTETFPVTCEINPGEYTKTQTVHDLAPGDSTQVTFFTEFTFESGTYTVTVYTKHDDDENPANDTLEKVIQTQDPGVAEGGSVTPAFFSFGLKSNPAKRKALFNLALPEAATITLRIYDITGRLVDNLVSGRKSAGTYEIPWTKDVSSGIFFYHLDSPWKTEVGKLVLVR